MKNNFFKKIILYTSGSNLQSKIILFFVVLATVPVLILGGVAVFLIDLSHRIDVSNLELQLLGQKTEEIEKFFADTAGILELQVGFSQKAPIGLNEQHFILNGIMSENQSFEEVSFVDVEGLIVNDAPTIAGKETSKLVRDSHSEIELFNILNLKKYTAPLLGQAYVGEVYRTLKGPVVTISAPVRNRNGDLIQVLSAEINVNQIRRFITGSSLGFSGGLTLLDADGTIIASRNSAASEGVSLSGFERIKEMLAGRTFDALADEDRYQSIIDGKPVIGAGKKIPSTGWIIFAEWPLDDADSVIRDVRNQVLTLTLISILAVLLIAPFFALRITKPIQDLKIGVSKIEEGDLNQKVKITTADELEDLGKAFNKMGEGLKRLEELKNEFVFIAAHELRTPVTAVKGYVSMILEGDAGPIPEAIKKFLEPIQQANERLIKLVNDILEIARNDAGRITIQVFSVNISPAIKAVIKEVLPLAIEKSIAINYNEPTEMPLVLADTIRLREVITNFISNAIKYGRIGGWIKIYHEPDGKFIITHIEDNGIGIPKPEQGRIFEKFFRSETSKVAQIQGTGLGLFITKELIEKMGGKVWFITENDKGTRFSFRLPRPKI